MKKPKYPVIDFRGNEQADDKGVQRKAAVLRRVEYAIDAEGVQTATVETKYVNKPVERKELKKFVYMSKEDMKREKVKNLRL
jgi:hypothetical protein